LASSEPHRGRRRHGRAHRCDARAAGRRSDWQGVELEADVAADEPTASPTINYPVERPFLETYTAKLPVPDAGAWIDLRVTAKDAAGNTFSQEIERAFEAAPAKKGGPHCGGRPCGVVAATPAA
jgi:hypothetical protein